MELANLYYIDSAIKKIVLIRILNYELSFDEQFYILRRCSDSLLIYESRIYYEVKNYAENQEYQLAGPFFKYGT
ncbi:hypothetical protein JWG44_05365 [Leptospira sp. 201903071]|uniref:hypothetical protein n=1 Tax=Leptospira ainazelensis TaxID=2810034 RepID=UPI0019650B69|nr:hypothetical protein [Leptospira ainazelensis]MBM9499678.1 hypothetical protein [Leptospira ainazelensis]